MKRGTERSRRAEPWDERAGRQGFFPALTCPPGPWILRRSKGSSRGCPPFRRAWRPRLPGSVETLTVAGHAINDTIVIFDRIRESLRAEGGTLGDKINEAINATLSRTLLTSSTTILTVAILLVFGGSALRDFSFTILVGLLIGTYSSVFIASPLVLWWNGRNAAGVRAEGIAGEDSGKGFFQSVP